MYVSYGLQDSGTPRPKVPSPTFDRRELRRHGHLCRPTTDRMRKSTTNLPSDAAIGLAPPPAPHSHSRVGSGVRHRHRRSQRYHGWSGGDSMTTSSQTINDIKPTRTTAPGAVTAVRVTASSASTTYQISKSITIDLAKGFSDDVLSSGSLNSAADEVSEIPYHLPARCRVYLRRELLHLDRYVQHPLYCHRRCRNPSKPRSTSFRTRSTSAQETGIRRRQIDSAWRWKKGRVSSMRRGR